MITTPLNDSLNLLTFYSAADNIPCISLCYYVSHAMCIVWASLVVFFAVFFFFFFFFFFFAKCSLYKILKLSCKKQ